MQQLTAAPCPPMGQMMMFDGVAPPAPKRRPPPVPVTAERDRTPRPIASLGLAPDAFAGDVCTPGVPEPEGADRDQPGRLRVTFVVNGLAYYCCARGYGYAGVDRRWETATLVRLYTLAEWGKRPRHADRRQIAGAGSYGEGVVCLDPAGRRWVVGPSRESIDVLLSETVAPAAVAKEAA